MKQQNPHTIAVEESLREFYDSQGWKTDGEHSKDASLWEDTRKCARAYVSACRMRIRDYLPATGEVLLDAASGPVQYPEYLTYSAGFTKRVCVDLSTEALKQAESKLGNKGEYVRCSILDLLLPDNLADASISLHTIYHIEASAQEIAVRQLLRVTKPNHSLLVVYANPDRLSSRISRALALVRKRITGGAPSPGEVYYYAHPLSWWQRFSDSAEIELVTWRTLTAKLSRKLIPDNAFGTFLLRILFRCEELFPHAMLPFAAYPLVVLKKRSGSQ